MRKVQEFLKDEEGASGVEYSIIAALIAGVIIAAVTLIGIKTFANFKKVDSNW